jgi:hypothetical protein
MVGNPAQQNQLANCVNKRQENTGVTVQALAGGS